MEHKWVAGQQAAIGTTIVKIERVTPSGRVMAGGRKFRPDGYEMASGYGRGILRPLTPDVLAEIEQSKQSELAGSRLYKATGMAERWCREHCSSYRRSIMTQEEIAAANRLADAIETAMEPAP